MVQMINLRHVVSEDIDILFDWRNDPFIYQKFFNAQPVTKNDHVVWFDRTIMNSNIRLFIIELLEHTTEWGSQATPIGQIRFDRSERGNSCEVSISLPEQHTGKGFGTEAIRKGCIRVQKIWNGIEVIARFVPQNCPSKKAFSKAGFRFLEEKSTTMVYRP